MFNDVQEVPQFDLVVMDEIESLLNQFSSETTFKGKKERRNIQIDGADHQGIGEDREINSFGWRSRCQELCLSKAVWVIHQY